MERHPHLIMVSGAPGAGKTGAARALAMQLQPVAEVYTDEIRHRVQPYELPWVEPTGEEQLRLGIESACATAQIYLHGNYNVVMNDVLVPESFDRYQELLDTYDGITILLKPPVEVAIARDSTREKHVPHDQIRLLYNDIPEDRFDLVIDNEYKTIENVVKEILNYIHNKHL